ncbi:unnamed protein product [Jaminaea pallidilutea]
MAANIDGATSSAATTATQSPAGISLPVTEWGDAQVSSWLASLQLPSLAATFREQGIQGDVLVQLDHDALKDLGVHSVGQRLALLGGLYRLKEVWGIDIDEGDYKPRSEDIISIANRSALGADHTVYSGSVTIPQLTACLRERDERIIRLEQELRRATVFLSRFQDDFNGVCRYQGLRAPTTDHAFQPFVPATPSAMSVPAGGTGGAGTGSSGSGGLGRKISVSHGPGMYSQTPSVAPSPASHHPALAFHSPSSPSVPLAPLSVHTKSVAAPTYDAMRGSGPTEDSDERTRMPTSAGTSTEPPSPGFPALRRTGEGINDYEDSSTRQSVPDAGTAAAPLSAPPSATLPSSNGGVRPARSATPVGANSGLAQHRSADHSFSDSGSPYLAASNVKFGAHGASPSPSLRPEQLSQPLTASTDSTSKDTTLSLSDSGDASTTPATTPSFKDTLSHTPSMSTSDNPYKSFRVTLEDPCYKVLPAALKKYKINDDWRLYALFICYGTTERCLSYEDKPLLLFQKLKEANMNPVFMLRHIRDVKSPITIANAKAAAKTGNKDGKDGASNGSGTVAASSSSGKAPASRLVAASEAIVLGSGAVQAVKKAQGSRRGQFSQAADIGQVLLIGPAAGLSIPQPTTPLEPMPRTYAIAIYPYSCERDDEFDVHIGDTFVVLSKAKGWWVVQQDSRATGAGDAKVSDEAARLGGPENRTDVVAEVRTGWVPAGCLIETSQPLAPFLKREGRQEHLEEDAQEVLNDSSFVSDGAESGAKASTKLHEKSAAPIPPSLITSNSTPGVMLMDFSAALTETAMSAPRPSSAAGADGGAAKSDSSTAGPNVAPPPSSASGGASLELKRGDRLRVFKRYNHWSYCVQEDGNHARGWIPSWYIGKVSSSSSATPSSSGRMASGADGRAAGSGSGSSRTTPTTAGSIMGIASTPSSRVGSAGADFVQDAAHTYSKGGGLDGHNDVLKLNNVGPTVNGNETGAASASSAAHAVDS